MALTQGAPLPDITSTTTQASTAPDYYTQYLSSLSQAGQQAMGRAPGSMVAGYDPMQTQGYAAIPGAAQAYQPGLTAAQQTASQAAAPNIQQFMNPYTSSVVDEMSRLSQQNVQRNLLPSMKAGFVGSGGLGGQRYAGALGQSMADVQANLTGAQSSALQSGYNQAVQAALQEQQNQNSVAQTQGALGAKAQELGLTGAGALTKAGAEKQAYQQSLLDAPLRVASESSKLLGGYQVPLSQQSKVVGPGQAGQYQQSPLQNVMGILSLIGAANVPAGTNQSAGQSQGSGAKVVYDWAKQFLPNVVSGNETSAAQQGLADYILNYNSQNYG